MNQFVTEFLNTFTSQSIFSQIGDIMAFVTIIIIVVFGISKLKEFLYDLIGHGVFDKR